MSQIRRRQQARQQRAQGGARGFAREMMLPLPLKGVFSEARDGEMSAQYAGEMANWRTNGALLETQPANTLIPASSDVLKRLPFEFGSSSVYIELTSTGARGAEASFARTFGRDATVGYLSSQALIADGRGAPLRFDGQTFTESEFTTTTGITQDQFDGVIAHHDRPYFWRIGKTLEFYYGDVGAVTGELTRFPLDRLGNITGQVVALQSLTVDAGHGMNDVLAIFTTTGDMVIYEGLDPGNADDWRLAGRVKVAPPLGVYAFTQVGSDLWVMTSVGVVSMAQSIARGAQAMVSQVTRRCARTFCAPWNKAVTGSFMWRPISLSWSSIGCTMAHRSSGSSHRTYRRGQRPATRPSTGTISGATRSSRRPMAALAPSPAPAAQASP